MKYFHENIFDPELCLYDMVSSRTAMKYGEIKPGDWERRRKEKEEKRRHTVGLFKRRAITLLMLVSVCVWFRKEYFFLWFLMFFNFNFMIFT